ncbi:MAG: large conductance mechanosensitive channel protein MscL [Clostridia bacterium]|nr:large conductance mechanosensitive channel protein MscL [Clostridia bacterium]
MKKLWKEFKAFITRGNVVDMAVGVIIASAFTAIVTAMTSNIIQPLVNWIIYLCVGDIDGTGYTFLSKVYTDGVLDLDASIYIDWGALVSAIIDFILIAIILFAIIKIMAGVSSSNKKLKEGAKQEKVIAKRAKEIKKSENISYTDAKAKAEKLIAEEEAKAKAEADAKAAEEAKNKAPTTEELLTQIRDLLAANPQLIKTEDTDTEEKAE